MTQPPKVCGKIITKPLVTQYPFILEQKLRERIKEEDFADISNTTSKSANCCIQWRVLT